MCRVTEAAKLSSAALRVVLEISGITANRTNRLMDDRLDDAVDALFYPYFHEAHYRGIW